jgi:ribosome-associated toxin RatA of RatAB toxin-antitoxin module
MSDPGDAVVKVRLAPDGKPLGAAAVARIEHPVSVVWAAIADIERYARHLPMVHRARRQGDDVTFDLRFKIGFFSVGFSFSAHATYEKERWLELRYLSGEPKDIRLRFELTPSDDGKACTVEGDGAFDMMSLGWLAKYFLRHHPEIQFGILPGVALVLVDSLRKAADEGGSA